MHTFNYPFFTQNLFIATPDRLSEKKVLELEDLLGKKIATLFRNLSSRIPESYISWLNTADVGFPLEINSKAWSFIETNIRYYKSTNHIFTPFEDRYGKTTRQPIEEFWEIAQETHTITKKQLVNINSNHLLGSFIIDYLEILLKEYGIKEFLISGHNLTIASGNNDWAIEFSLPDSNKKLEIIANNSSAAMEVGPPQDLSNSPQRNRNPFNHVVTGTNWKAIIAESHSASHSRIVAKIATDIGYQYQFSEFATKWESGLTVVTPEEEILQFHI